jgi:hypothetical protein
MQSTNGVCPRSKCSADCGSKEPEEKNRKETNPGKGEGAAGVLWDGPGDDWLGTEYYLVPKVLYIYSYIYVNHFANLYDQFEIYQK